jgi:CBS domain-containing protein
MEYRKCYLEVGNLLLSLPKWKCYRCGEVYDQDIPPDSCTVCNANVSFWIDWTDAKSPLEEPVSKFMSADLLTIDINASAWDAARLMREKKTGSVFVTQGGKPVGIVTERDMLYKVVADDLPAAHVLLRKIMSSPLVTIDEQTSVKKAIELMQKHNFRRLLITHQGEAVGMVNEYDLFATAELKLAPA